MAFLQTNFDEDKRGREDIEADSADTRVLAELVACATVCTVVPTDFFAVWRFVVKPGDYRDNLGDLACTSDISQSPHNLEP